MNKLLGLLIRYALIVLFGLGNLFIFYSVFYPLTFYLTGLVLDLFGKVELFYSLKIILYDTTVVSLINACIAGSAYYLLFTLTLSIPNIKPIKRFKILGFVFTGLLVINVFRIVFMTLIANTVYFETIHMTFWYFLSLVFVVGIWFLAVKIFDIEEVPIYSDFKFLLEQTKKPKRNTKHN